MAETVGSLVDKISIVELKIFAMQKQVERTDAAADHIQRCADRLKVLSEQRDDLSAELTDLAGAVLAGQRRMKVYRQFKMYNDPAYKKV